MLPAVRDIYEVQDSCLFIIIGFFFWGGGVLFSFFLLFFVVCLFACVCL